jgi:hypothetical protein
LQSTKYLQIKRGRCGRKKQRRDEVAILEDDIKRKEKGEYTINDVSVLS